MATSIIGYPLETNYCPSCGSSHIEARDMWHQDGFVQCKTCGAKCFVIEAGEEGEGEDEY